MTAVKRKDKEGKKLKCRRPDCGYEWTYKGEARFYITCPMCHRKSRIKYFEIEEENENK